MLVMTLRPEEVMSQMLFSHDTELTLRAASALINSDRIDGEQLGDQPALDEYLDGFGWTGRRDRDDAELDSVHRLRTRLGKIWAVAGDEEQAEPEVIGRPIVDPVGSHRNTSNHVMSKMCFGRDTIWERGHESNAFQS
jgi:hypothetical protein